MVNNFFQAYADAQTARSLPLRRGVYVHGTPEFEFWTYLKTSAKFFLEEECGGKQMPQWGVYAGDLWLQRQDCLSDWYKDVYGVRPHFYFEYIANLCGLHCSMDTILHWTYGSLEQVAEESKKEYDRLWEYMKETNQDCMIVVG